MTRRSEFSWKIERSSLGTPVVKRLRARTAPSISDRIVSRAFEHSAKNATKNAGISDHCLYTSATAFNNSGEIDATPDRRRSSMAHKRTTGSKAASNAGKVLSNPKSTKAAKSAAASALSQKHGKGKKKR